MSIFASILRSVYKLSGAKKAFALPEDALRKEIEKQNRHRGVFTPTDRKAYYETIAVNGFFGDLVQRGFLKAVSKKFRISSLNDPIIQEMIPSGHVFTPLRLNNREPLIYTITVRTGYNPSRFQEDGLEVLL